VCVVHGRWVVGVVVLWHVGAKCFESIFMREDSTLALDGKDIANRVVGK